MHVMKHVKAAASTCILTSNKRDVLCFVGGFCFKRNLCFAKICINKKKKVGKLGKGG